MMRTMAPGPEDLAAGEESKREALTRLLAIESRNALARVELAASELGRFETTPSAADRLATIHHAVDQIDSLLAKIDILASPRNASSWPAICVADIWQRIRERLGSTLEARGIELILDLPPDGEGPGRSPRLEMPEPVLESIFYAGLRLVLASTDRDQRLCVEWVPGTNELRVGLRLLHSVGDQGMTERRSLEVPRDDFLELEVQLAEWRGSLVLSSEIGFDGIQVVLPVGPIDD